MHSVCRRATTTAQVPFPFSTYHDPSRSHKPNMAPDDDSSDLSSLSSLSPAPSDSELETKAKPGLLKFFPKLSGQSAPEPSQPARKRSPSPPHEYVLADNPDIAVRE